MKIIHLSDPHISPDKLFEHDAKERFSLALQHICNNHLDFWLEEICLSYNLCKINET